MSFEAAGIAINNNRNVKPQPTLFYSNINLPLSDIADSLRWPPAHGHVIPIAATAPTRDARDVREIAGAWAGERTKTNDDDDDEAMLSAFTARPLVELRQRDKSKIESVLTYGDRLLVGLNTGTLRIYRVNEVNGSSQEAEAETETAVRPRPTDLLREEEKFARYKIEQLALIREANVLVSLAGGYVSLHNLQTYELLDQLARTKGATAFAVTSNIVKDDVSGVPSIVSRLAVAVKRKIMLWTWRDMELEHEHGHGHENAWTSSAEITLVSGIKTLTWATGTRVLAGLAAGYVLVDVVTREVIDISGPGSIGGVGGGQESSGAAGGRLGVASMSYIGMGGMVPMPLATRLSDGHMLLAKDVNTHFIDSDGKSLRRKQIPWSMAPEAVGYSYPYLLALQDPSKGVMEVRNPETLSLLQSISLPSANCMHIPQPNISLAHAGKGFLVSSERVIWRMSALDYDSQIDALVEQAHLDEAISLIGMLEDALLTDKTGRLRSVKLRKAQTLFDLRKYQPALDLFAEISAPPELVIRLYPRIIAGDLSAVEGDESSDHGEDNNTAVSPGEDDAAQNPSGEGDVKSHGAEPATPDDKGKGKDVGYTPSMRSYLRTRTDDSSETSSVRGKQSDNVQPVDGKLQGKELKAAVRELQGFLADIRRRLQRYINADGTAKVSTLELDGDNDEFTKSVMHVLGVSSPDDLNDIDFPTRLRETASLVDNTLFRAHMFATPALAASLFRITNFCDPDVVMKKLDETGRYEDLIHFLFGKKLHRPALEQLRRFGQASERPQQQQEEEKGLSEAETEPAPETADRKETEGQEQDITKFSPPPQLIGPSRTVAYLQGLPPEMIDLILEFAEWPLRADPALGMQVFLADTENAETLPREKVLDFLQRIDARLAIRYLEHVIGELNDLTPELHQRLLMLYLDGLLDKKRKEGSGGDAAQPGGESGGGGGEDVDVEKEDGYMEKFLDLLTSSAQYSPAGMLDRLPRDDPDFFEARAITFSKMGQHKQALEIYVFKLENPQKAEEYCNQVHLSDDAAQTLPTNKQQQQHHHLAPSETEAEDHPSIYHTLLSLYLRPPHGYKPQYGPAIDILTRHGSRLPASAALGLIPEKFPVQDLEFYFRGRIRAANSIMNESRIVAGLKQAQNMKAEAGLALGTDAVSDGGSNRGRNRFVTVGEDRVCGLCHKRLGGSVISVFPDNSVAHLGCANRRAT